MFFKLIIDPVPYFLVLCLTPNSEILWLKKFVLIISSAPINGPLDERLNFFNIFLLKSLAPVDTSL